MTPSKTRQTGQTNFDRRRSPDPGETSSRRAEQGRRSTDARPKAGASPREATGGDAPDGTRKRRTTRDGRQPLVIYLRPESIKALKIAALERETTASAIVAEAMTSWLNRHSASKVR